MDNKVEPFAMTPGLLPIVVFRRPLPPFSSMLNPVQIDPPPSGRKSRTGRPRRTDDPTLKLWGKGASRDRKRGKSRSCCGNFLYTVRLYLPSTVEGFVSSHSRRAGGLIHHGFRLGHSSDFARSFVFCFASTATSLVLAAAARSHFDPFQIACKGS